MSKLRAEIMLDLDLINIVNRIFEGKSLNEKLSRAITLGINRRMELLKQETEQRTKEIAGAEHEE